MTRRHPGPDRRYSRPAVLHIPDDVQYAPPGTPPTGKAIAYTEARRILAVAYGGSWPPLGRGGWSRKWRTACPASEYPQDGAA